MNKSKNFNKKQNVEEAAKKAAKPVDDFDKIPEPEDKPILPLMMAALISAAKKENDPLFDGIIVKKEKIRASTDALRVFSETIKTLSLDASDLINKKLTPEMIKTIISGVIEVKQKETELSLVQKEKELELKEKLLAIKERELEFEVKKFEFENRKKEEA